MDTPNFFSPITCVLCCSISWPSFKKMTNTSLLAHTSLKCFLNNIVVFCDYVVMHTLLKMVHLLLKTVLDLPWVIRFILSKLYFYYEAVINTTLHNADIQVYIVFLFISFSFFSYRNRKVLSFIPNNLAFLEAVLYWCTIRWKTNSYISIQAIVIRNNFLVKVEIGASKNTNSKYTKLPKKRWKYCYIPLNKRPLVWSFKQHKFKLDE